MARVSNKNSKKELEDKSNVKSVKATAKKVSSKKTDTKKVGTKKVSSKETTAKKADTKKTSSKKATTKKTDTKKASSKKATTKKTDTKKVSSKKATTKKTDTKKASSKETTTKKTVAKKIKSTSKTSSTVKPMLEEYYDLPYRYNETTVKILAQTPTTLFVYWDISDEDRNSLMKQHGENVFYDTKPILIVHNTTKNYSFEIEINDFANSWYIRTQEPDCNYVIELGRKDFNKPEEYIHIYSSNNMVSPNDHILFEKTDLGNILFRNVKTNVLSSKDFGSLRFINDIDKLYGNVYDIYNKLYNDELNNISNPTSGEFMFKR